MNTTRWTDEVDQITRAFNRSFAQLTTDQLNWKPSPDSWSIAENMDHLIVVNSTYFTMVGMIREKKFKLPLVGKSKFMVNFFGRTVLQAVQPDRRKKMKTFPLWKPSSSFAAENILAQFEAHQEELKDLITSCVDLLDSGTVIHSPASRLVVYKLETAFDIIVAHEKRHLEQAREVLALFKGKI